MKVLVLGASGMLGHRIWIDLSAFGLESIGVTRKDMSFLGLPFIQVENLDEQNLMKVLDEVKPDVVINAVGVIKQAESISNYRQTIYLNTLLPHKLAYLAEKLNFKLILFGTDCVFKGDIVGAYGDDSAHDVLDIYGVSKSLGEVSRFKSALTLRLSILGRELFGHKSLLDWFLSQKGKTISGFKNAIFSGLPTSEVAEVLYKHILPNKDLSGVYNVSVDPISKFDLLSRIKKHLNLDIQIEENTEFKMNRALNSNKFRELVGYKPAKWEDLVSKLHLEDPLYERLGK